MTAAVVSGALTPLATFTSCIIADPPPDLPPLPRHHPIIVKESVVPAFLGILPQMPSTFIVPVELIDPTTPFAYRAFLDLDGMPQLIKAGDNWLPEPSSIDGGVVNIDFSPTDVAPDLSTCHRITFVVALSFSPVSLDTPDSYGADIAGWIYDPSGEPGSHCQRYDAGGADGAFPDQEADTTVIPPPPG